MHTNINKRMDCLCLTNIWHYCLCPGLTTLGSGLVIPDLRPENRTKYEFSNEFCLRLLLLWLSVLSVNRITAQFIWETNKFSDNTTHKTLRKHISNTTIDLYLALRYIFIRGVRCRKRYQTNTRMRETCRPIAIDSLLVRHCLRWVWQRMWLFAFGPKVISRCDDSKQLNNKHLGHSATSI